MSFVRTRGTPLAATTLKQVDTAQLTRRGTPADHVVRYFQADQLRVEQYYDQRLVYQNFYDDNQLVQRVFYNASAQPMAINNFQSEELKETLLLNGHGDLVYRLMLKSVPHQKFIDVGTKAVLRPEVPTGATTTSKRGQVLTEIAGEKTTVKVLDYVNAMDFKGRYDFYRYALQRLGGTDARLYVNVAHAGDIAAALPDQLIYNY